MIRNKVMQNLEQACMPTTSDEERRRLLSFVVSGGGPTGVEFAAELFDMLNEDLGRSFPKILRNEISVHVIQSRGHILNTYDEALSKFAEARFAHDQVEVLTNSRVKEVQTDKILFSQKDEKGRLSPKNFQWASVSGLRVFLRLSFAKELPTRLMSKIINMPWKQTRICASMVLHLALSMPLEIVLQSKTILLITSSTSCGLWRGKKARILKRWKSPSRSGAMLLNVSRSAFLRLQIT